MSYDDIFELTKLQNTKFTKNKPQQQQQNNKY